MRKAPPKTPCARGHMRLLSYLSGEPGGYMYRRAFHTPPLPSPSLNYLINVPMGSQSPLDPTDTRSPSLAAAPGEVHLSIIQSCSRPSVRGNQYQLWTENPGYPPSWRLSVRYSAASPASLHRLRHWSGGWTRMRAVALASQVSWRWLRMPRLCLSGSPGLHTHTAHRRGRSTS